MSIHLFHKTAFGFYNVSWSIALPWLRFHHRLAKGYKQRTLKGRLPAAADLWIQAASVGESWLALELIKTLGTRDPLRILLTSNTQREFKFSIGDWISKSQRQTGLRRMFVIFPLTNRLLW